MTRFEGNEPYLPSEMVLSQKRSVSRRAQEWMFAYVLGTTSKMRKVSLGSLKATH